MKADVYFGENMAVHVTHHCKFEYIIRFEPCYLQKKQNSN